MPVVSSANCDSAHTACTGHRTERKDTSLSRHADMSLRRNRRRHSLQECAPAHFRKHKDVEEMHDAKHQHDYADLATDRFEHFANIRRSDALLQRQCNVADVDKIEANDKEVIDRIRQSFVAVERVNQENAPVFMQRVRYPDGERNAQCDVNNVSPNYWSHGNFLCRFLFSMGTFFGVRNLIAQGTILRCSDWVIFVITLSASSRKSLRSLSCLLKAAGSAPRKPFVRLRHSFKTACAGRSSRRRRSRMMMQNIFQTFFSASKNSLRSPLRTTLRTKPQLTRSRRLL